MKSTNRKVIELENHVLQEPELGSTKICTCGFPEPEQIVLEKARKLVDWRLTYEEARPQEQGIIDKANEILRFRIFDLFTGYLEGLLCQDDRIAKMVLHERFLWFIKELAKDIQQQLEVTEIERNTPEDCEVDKVDEYFRKAPKLYTEDSYDKLQTELFQEVIKNNPDFLKTVERST